MNKKEIAQQFTRQMIEQSPSTLSQEQVIAILQKIQSTYSRAEQSSSQYSNNLRILSSTMEGLRTKSQKLNSNFDQLNEKMEAASTLFRKSQMISIWQRYWMAILIGILSTLITNLIWVLTIR